MAQSGSPHNKRLKEKKETDDTKSLVPRDYQIEILEAAKQENTIACLGTGTGKTFIAVMLIRENANPVRIPYDEGGKRIFFLVPTVPLVTQQSSTIKDHTDLTVGSYYGEMDVNSWDKNQWINEFQTNEVLVMTAEIFRIIIDHAFIPLKRIQLLIFDECHRAQGDHPYRQAMKCFTTLPAEDMPRIFGLSASLLNGKCKPSKLEKYLRDLEKTLRSTIVTASDLIDLRKHGTDPNECAIIYKKNDIANTSLVREIEVLMSKIRDEKSASEKNQSFNDDDIIFFDKPLRCLNSILLTLTQLGPWCAHKAADMFVREVQILLSRSRTEKFSMQLEEICSFLEYFRDMCKCLDPDGTEVNVMPHKLKRLMEVLSAAKKSTLFQSGNRPLADNVAFEEDPEHFYQIEKQKKDSDMTLSSIIFVEQRIVAFVLCQWLLKIKNTFPNLDYLEPEFIVGHGRIGAAATSMSEKLQGKKVKDFREKKHNVLVATQVLEEGMDIRQCNLVVRFDLPGDFRSYVQSKGRARAKNSIYAMLIEEGEMYSRFMMDLINFKTIEDMLQTKCHDRSMPTEEEISSHMADAALPPYMPHGPDGPRITMSAAISLINRYCASLPCDMATKLVPRWNIEVVDPDCIDKEYVCNLRMPINSPLRKIIVSEAMRKKKLAKMSAALKACQMLDEIGELNEHLIPMSCLVDQAIEDEVGIIEEEDCKEAIPGTKRRRQVYDKGVPIFLRGIKPEAGRFCYVSILNMKLIEPLPKTLNPRNRPLFDPAETPRGLALVCTVKLPHVNPFPIFTKCGKILVTLSACNEPFLLTDTNIKDIEEFHRFIFAETLWIEGVKEFLPCVAPSSYYICPVLEDKIDWDFIKFTLQHPYHVQKLKTKEAFYRTVFDAEKFTDCVLMRSYKIDTWKHETPTFHHVVKICYNMTPCSTFMFNSKYKTFKKYYEEKYEVTINDLDQPLVETVQMGGLHMWKPLYVSPKETFDDKVVLSKSKQRHRDYREFLVPELSVIHPFPSSFFFKVMCLPTMLFRLNGLYLAEELRRCVAREARIGSARLPDGANWPPFRLENSDKALTDYLFKIGELQVIPHNKIVCCDIVKDINSNEISSFEVKVDLKNHIGPDPSLLLQALTSKSAGDEFDLERLEVIGDSFLKFAMSVKTYIKYPTFDEGKLTQLRSRLIQNLHLYQKAKKKNLGQYLSTSCFSCQETWLPPCYFTEDHVDEKNVIIKSKKQKLEAARNNEEVDSPRHLYFTKQVISDKCVADSVEALIGSYLLSSGQLGALRFMNWFGLNPFVEKDVECDFEVWPPPPPNPIVDEHPSLDFRLKYLTDGFDRFEKIIGYKFKNKVYLLQAFTHPSFCDNDLTDCYQRLEFLGDSVLDYLITRQLYEDPSGHSPGKLTDLRSALVNNIYFASLAVCYRYNEFLKMLSPNLFRLMNEYIKILKNSEAFKYFEEHKYYLQEIECFELEEVEVPKALGDVFESVAGAIYLDSGMSLDTVWRVCYPMICPAMKHLCEHVPLSPVRELYELTRQKTVFGEPIMKNDKTYIEVFLPNGQKFQGIGPNKKVAKRSAAKRALAELKSAEKMDIS